MKPTRRALHRSASAANPVAVGPSVTERLNDMLSVAGELLLDAPQARAFSAYLDLLQQWNRKINLTSVRDQEGILSRHFLESIVCARRVPDSVQTLLDYGSGGGFPGLPCAICRPEMQVTLAEAQTKKAVFLREAVRVIGLNTSVFHGRVESIERDRCFDAVTLRAVERMEDACAQALLRVNPGGWLLILAGAEGAGSLRHCLQGLDWEATVPLPGSGRGSLLLGRKR